MAEEELNDRQKMQVFLAAIPWMLLAVIVLPTIIGFMSPIFLTGQYAGKSVTCIPGNFTVTISSDYAETYWYLRQPLNELQFMGTDGKMYRCVGSMVVG